VLVPVKSFAEAKVRLAPALDAESRAALARQMAEVVLAAACPLPVAVVCDDPDVAEWARARGAEVFWRPERGLNGAVADGVARFADAGFDRVIVAHADLPLADTLGWVAEFDGVTLVPDRRDDGTNVICVPPVSGSSSATGRARSSATSPRPNASASRSGWSASRGSGGTSTTPTISTCPPT
jgi:2-phospho-L-lactate/phosphoenolpyruvate guanylyltransferase